MDIRTDLITDDARALLDHAATIADAEPFDTGVETDTPHTEPERHAIEYLAEHDIDLCGATDSRLFFELPDNYTRTDQSLMAKLARYSDDPETAGTTHNQRERVVWESATDAKRDHLSPIIDAHEDDEWVLTFKPEQTERDTIPDTLTDAIAEHDWDPDAVTPTDVGRRGEADPPVLVNYGRLDTDSETS